MGRAFEYRRAAKEKRWGKMSKLFPRLGKQITMAAKEGGEDPTMNAKLRLAIQNAKANNMPKNNIEAAIKRASGKDAADYTEVVYEGKGPHGLLVVVECATDNTTRTVANVRSYFNKCDGTLVTTGQLDFMFERKVEIDFIKPEGLDLEELEFELIEAGLEEIDYDETENKVFLYGPYTEYGTLTSAVEEKGIEIGNSGLKRFATTPVEFTEEQMVDIDKFMNKVEEDDDVQAVYTNMA